MNSVDRVKKLCKDRSISIHKLEKDLGFSNGYISQLKKGTIPTERAQKIADYFEVSFDFIANGNEGKTLPDYFLDQEAQESANFLHKNPDYKVLMDSVRKIPASDIQYIKDLIDRMYK